MHRNQIPFLSFIMKKLEFFKPRKQTSFKESIIDLITHHKEKLDDEGREILENFTKFTSQQVHEIMIPRADMLGIDIDTSFVQVKDLLLKKGHSRIPVYQANLDNILGFIHIKDFIKYIDKPEKFILKENIRTIIYVSKYIGITDLLSKMKKRSTHIAIMLNEYGGTEGMVTTEDIVEALVGDIKDEHELPSSIGNIIQVSNNVFVVDGRVEVDTLAETIGVPIHIYEEYDTIAGHLLAHAGKVPKTGEKFVLPIGIEAEILDADSKRIKKVKITKIIRNTNKQKMASN